MLGFFVDSQTFIMAFMIQTFVWGIICLFTLLVIRKITPIPIVMEAWKGKIIRKCFLSVPVIHDPSNLSHVSSSYSYPHKPAVGGPPPYITAAEQQASPRTLRDRRTMYSHTGQYDHTLSKKQLYQVTRSLYPEDFTPKMSLWLQLKHSNL